MAQTDDSIKDTQTEEDGFFLITIIKQIFYSPINIILLLICVYLLYKIFYRKEEIYTPVPELPPLKKRDMSYQELQKYDGTNEEGRVCIAVNGKIFDVTKGKHFYGPGGPYESFAGKDATRCLATFSVEGAKSEYDDISDLNLTQMESVREWELQFTERYRYVGRLLKPGEEPTDYSEEEDISQDQTTLENPNNTSSKKDD